MKISVSDARKRLAKVGIELGPVQRRKVRSHWMTQFQMTTPIGSKVTMGPRDVACLVRELDELSVA